MHQIYKSTTKLYDLSIFLRVFLRAKLFRTLIDNGDKNANALYYHMLIYLISLNDDDRLKYKEIDLETKHLIALG